MNAVNPVLAHKLGLMPSEPEQVAAPTPMRQMRRALGRAADKAVGLSSSVLGIAEEELEAEALIESAPQDWLVIGLREGANAGLTGLFLIDPALRSALVEMQTMGNLLPPATEERAVTRTDAILSIPFASQLLSELAEVGFGVGVLDPAAYDLGPIEDLRTAGLVMTQGVYRSWRITLQVGGGDKQGEILIAMRPDVTATVASVDKAPAWAAGLRNALQDAPADLDAVLTRLVLSICKIEEFEVGQVLHLAGTTVGSITLTGPSGEQIAMARLGQVAGKRAVRIEVETVELQPDIPKDAPQIALRPEPENSSTDAPDLVEG